jgi:flagellar biosynthesis protein FlhF
VTAAIDFDAESLNSAPVQPLVDAPESPLLRRETTQAREPARASRDSALAPRDAALARREMPPIKDEDAPIHSKLPPSLDDLPTYEPAPAAQRCDVAPLPSMPCGIDVDSPLISRELQTALLDSLVVRDEEASRAAPATAPHAKPADAAHATLAPASTAVARLEAQAAYATQPLDFDLTEPAEVPRIARAAHHAADADVVGTELKNLRRMLETQLAQLAWNDMTRRAPVHTEMLRELSEIGIAQDLSSQITQQLSQDVDLTYARRFSIAALSQYLLVTGDRWLDSGGRIAFIGSTGVGKTMTLSKLAVRWVLRHGARDLALVAADNIRLGAQDQMRALGQLLGAPVYTPENFETLPTLLSKLQQRFILIDTPGSSLRDTQLSSRLAVLASSASQLQTALVLAASTQAGALEEVVKRFAPANPCCCVLTKVDEAASLGGALSVLIRARIPVSYVSEGQRVPEDLRPARALELVAHAVRLAKATGAAADEDLLRRRFGKIANAIT